MTKLLKLDLELNEFLPILRQKDKKTCFMVIPEMNATHTKRILMKEVLYSD